MKTKELIKRLQEADPEGDAECVVGGSDIYFVSKEPMYYDGLPIILLHDESKKPYYSIKGFKSSSEGFKIQFHTMNMEDVISDNPECIVELNQYAEQHKGKRIEELREEYRHMNKEIEAERVKKNSK